MRSVNVKMLNNLEKIKKKIRNRRNIYKFNKNEYYSYLTSLTGIYNCKFLFLRIS